MAVELAHKTECALAQELAPVMAMVLAQETGRDSAETTAPPWAWATANLRAGASAAGLATVSERDSAVGSEHALALASGAASAGLWAQCSGSLSAVQLAPQRAVLSEAALGRALGPA